MDTIRKGAAIHPMNSPRYSPDLVHLVQHPDTLNSCVHITYTGGWETEYLLYLLYLKQSTYSAYWPPAPRHLELARAHYVHVLSFARAFACVCPCAHVRATAMRSFERQDLQGGRLGSRGREGERGKDERTGKLYAQKEGISLSLPPVLPLPAGAEFQRSWIQRSWIQRS
jgi:hypothetical protein